MAGSSLPTLWRYPEADVERGRPLKEIVATSYGGLDAYGFHALEMVQCLAERRKQGDSWGESGIKQVRCLEGDAVWQAGRDGVVRPQAARRGADPPQAKAAARRQIDRSDRQEADRSTWSIIATACGRASSGPARSTNGRLPGAIGDGSTQSTCFWTQEGRPYMHFTYLLKGVEQMMHTGQPAWPVERTLLTSGALDAALQSHSRGGQIIETPYLNIAYKSDWTWQQPPPPPPARPSDRQ